MSSSIKISKSEKVFDYANIISLGILSAISIYPLIYVLFGSLSDSGELMKHKGLLLAPIGIHFDAYKLVFKNPIIFTSYSNTIMYVVVGTCISLFLTILGAYAFSRRTLWGTTMMLIVVFTMWFSGGMIPYYLLVRDLGMLNTRWALIIPKAIVTYNLIVMRTSFQAVPVSLEESARIDGANDLVILFKIILPLSIPVIAVITLFYSVAQWNAWFDAMLFINNRLLLPLQIVLREIIILNSTDSMMAGSASQGDQIQIGETIKYAAIIVATVPILSIYPFLQKYFVKGIMIGAIKE